MAGFRYVPLLIEGPLEADMRRHLAVGSDAAIAARTFATLCLGRSDGRPPRYSDAARTVGRVENDGQPPPELNVFDWGGDVFGVPPLRIWYVQRRGQAPQGIGAFVADGEDLSPDLEEVESRVRALFRDPGCYPQLEPRGGSR